ncbi:hypothetical protein AX769_16930 [Frondihabitans sp. PAMC 28766]|uniref:DUF1905 domain-containing protein n=1 Tax=Frondihabitans sp. PAMC 28766 TaxID=1795630 RepID=UPI00078B2D7B|nr:DUF1905 domain-containing protein [Frondihabitans sp. PAMC 28766]AMM21516.1 hypothetical protein AX769_16930 [Frondihabitans sp. PAMC 28766]
MRFTFTNELWRWAARRELWTFVTLSPEADDQIVAMVGDMTNGWGSIRVDARVGQTSFRTSIFPAGDQGAYVLPVKRAVRDAEGLELGVRVTAEIVLVDF